MKFHTVAKQFTVSALALSIAVGCASNAKQEDTSISDAEQQAAAELAAQQAAAEAAAREAEARARAEAERLAQLAAQQAAQNISYTVVGGDSLWSIAGKGSTYGNPYAWPLIYKANKAQINDADLIFPGQSFAIDTGISGSEMDSAISHAKTRGAWSVGSVEASDSDYLSR